MQDMVSSRRISINLVANLISFIISFLISFFVTRYIVEKLGSSVYGMIPIANNFITYFNLVMIALNSMSVRFVTLELRQKNLEKANEYFSSAFYSNITMTLVMIIPFVFIVLFISRIINIPEGFLFSTQLLFAFLFANFLSSLIMNVFSIAPYASNRLDIQAFITIVNNVLRAVLTLLAFLLFKPSIAYIGAVVLFCGMITLIANIYFTKKLLPELKISGKFFKFQRIRELISAGIWASVSQLSAIMLSGLSLLIANIFLGAENSGPYSLALMVPNMISGLIATLTSIFVPSLLYCYADKDIKKLVGVLKKANNFISMFMGVIASMYIVFGQEFYQLWVPSEDAVLLQKLTLIIIIPMIAFACNATLFSVYTVANKLKMSSLVTLATGIISIIFTYILLKTTYLGLYAIPIASSFLSLLTNAIFHPIYTAKCLNIKKTTFFPQLVKASLAIVISAAVAFFIKKLFVINSWQSLIACGLVSFVPCVIIIFFISQGRTEAITTLKQLKRMIVRNEK